MSTPSSPDKDGKDDEARLSRRKQKQEANQTSGCGFGKTKKRLIEIFWSAIWPGLEKIGWTKVEGTGRQAGALFFVPKGVTVTKGKKSQDYYDRIRDVIDRVCANDASPDEAAIAELFLKKMEQLDEFEIPDDLPLRKDKKGSDPQASSAVPVDLSWKDGGASYPKVSSRVGKTYQATHLPRAGSFTSKDMKLDPDLQIDMVWDFKKAKNAGALNYVHCEIQSNKKEAAMVALHKLNYEKDSVKAEIKNHKVLDGSDWTQEQKQLFVKEMFRLRKNLVAVSKSIGVPINEVFTYYLGKFKKSDNYRLLKTICEEERAEKLAASEQGLDACGICGDGGSLLICDGCEGEYHMHCLCPPLANIPEGHWECDDCVNRKFLEVRDKLIKKFYVRVSEGSSKKRKAESMDSGDDSDGGATRKKKNAERRGSGNVILRPSESVLKAVRELADTITKALSAE